MLPLGHAALGYLLYASYVRLSTTQVPLRYTLVPLAVGTQFPDLIDKPLAYFDLLPYGRSLTHSLVAFAIVTALVRRAARRFDSTSQPDWHSHVLLGAPAAFAIGYASHLLGDAYEALLAGNFFEARFLLYPLYVLPDSPADDTVPWVRLVHIYQDMGTHPQLEFILLALAVFVGARIRAYRTNRSTTHHRI